MTAQESHIPNLIPLIPLHRSGLRHAPPRADRSRRLGGAASLLAALVLVWGVLPLCSGRAAADAPSVNWVVRYSGLGNGNNQVMAMVVDSRDKVYVTGYSSGLGWDVATVEYSPSGRQLHAVRYNGAPGGDDVPYGIALDADGNVLVVGYTCVVSQFNHDFFTVKYDSTLTQQWIQTYAGQGNFGLDEAYAVATDASGNVYVTGDSFEPATSDDIATIKYNAAGVRQWVERFNGIGNAGDAGNAIGVDSNGNVLVTGITQRSPNGGNMDLTTLKYNPSGTLLWSETYNGPGNSNDGGVALKLDSTGSVYVSGFRTGSGTLFDMITVKYSPTGHQRWLQTFDGNHGEDAVKAMTLDRDANVYVTGFATFSGTQSDYATVKYDSTGTQQWMMSYNGPVTGFDEAQSVAVDRNENVYITGYSDGGTGLVNYDYATLRYDSGGTQQWVVRYNGTGNNIDIGVGVALDSRDNVIVGGWSTGTHNTDVDFTTIQYGQGGNASAPGIPSDLTGALRLYAAAPNPFEGTTVLRFHLPERAPVDVTLLDASGRVVRTLHPGWMEAGDQKAVLSGADLAPGLYLVRLRAGAGSTSGRVVRR